MKTIIIDGIEYQLTPVATEAPKPVQWEPKRLTKNQTYWSIDTSGRVFQDSEKNITSDNLRAAFGNYFRTEQEVQEAAKQVCQLLRLRAYVREFAPDYKPDWDNGSEQKWYTQFDEGANKWFYSNNQVMRTVTTVYMPKNVAKELAHKLNNGEVVLWAQNSI